jgi:hypothetical protein
MTYSFSGDQCDCVMTGLLLVGGSHCQGTVFKFSRSDLLVSPLMCVSVLFLFWFVSSSFLPLIMVRFNPFCNSMQKLNTNSGGGFSPSSRDHSKNKWKFEVWCSNLENIRSQTKAWENSI